MKTERRCAQTLAASGQVIDLLQKDAQDILETQDKTRYVILESEDERVCRFGQRNQVSVVVKNSGFGVVSELEPNSDLREMHAEEGENSRGEKCMEDVRNLPSPSSSPCLKKNETRLQIGVKSGESAVTHTNISKGQGSKAERDEESHSTNSYLSGRSEWEDCEEVDNVSLVLSDESAQCVTEDHYITTHEIQLSELSDHEGDYDLGMGSTASWDIEDENQVYPFVDYSLEGSGAAGERGAVPSPRSQGAAAAAVSTLLESDLCDSAKFCGSDEPEQKQHGGSSRGQIHLSIRTTSRAINDSSSIQEEGNILYHARRARDMSRYVFRGVDGKAETLCDRAKSFIAAPGRLHFGGRLRGKEVTEYSSGTSSAVSELDDADKEVRNLTARAFKSLAYPYFEAINFSTSSESSASEHGLGINRWSTFLDLKYGNVNMSQGLDQSVISCQNSATSYEIAKNRDNRGYKGIKPPTSKIFSLNANPHSASSSKQIQLMGKFGQGHSGVIRLTETLNFRCNVKSGMSGEERRTNFVQNAAGSRSTDEVTKSLQSSQQRGASKLPSKTMEDMHKKAIFASSLIKNVISKKMQFEQERRMERGEISEPHQAPSPCFVQQEHDSKWKQGSRELERQSSKFSESGSDYAIMCMEELGDFVESGSCDSKRQDACAPATETNLNSPNEAGIDTKKGALLRSQNSAFRCWKDEDLGFQKDHKNHQTPVDKLPPVDDKDSEWDPSSAGFGKLTKMSHLFVPSIQLLAGDGEVGPQLHRGVNSRNGSNTLYITDSRSSNTSKSPEIKINLRSVRDSKTEQFGVSKLRAPNITSSPSTLIRTDVFKCQALTAALKGESSDKVPHFMVRDIRDNKGKLQTPIHQVRDVRKLVKSSYHFVSLDKNENKSMLFSSESHPEQKQQIHNSNPDSVSPMVIKCQSVNTKNTEKPTGHLGLVKPEQSDTCRSSREGAKSAPPQRASGRAENMSNSSEGSAVSCESKMGLTKQETEMAENKAESKVANQVALEKLQAAVKTMEQLYVFDKNEWKRKREPQPLTDSHVLSMLASEEQQESEEGGGRGFNTDKAVRRDSYPNIDKLTPALSGPPSTDSSLRWLDKDLLKVYPTSNSNDERLVTKTVQTVSTTGSKNNSNFSSKPKAYTAANVLQPNTISHTSFSGKTFPPKSPKLSMSSKTSRTGISGKEDTEPRGTNRFEHQFTGASVDNENYLAIPVKSQPCINKAAASADKTPVKPFSHQSQPTPPTGHEEHASRGQEDHNQMTKRSRIVMETHSPEIPSATIYHSLPMAVSASQPQMYCFSPAVTPAPTLDPFLATQRKMLLDPTTGNYYLVDTPVSPATRRLFDPETGQYVDVPIPQPPMTPVSMPISPLALSPGAYGHTYMIYPGFMPTPSVIPARTLVQSQLSVPSEAESVEKASSQQTEGMYLESPFYMATGKPPQAASGNQPQGASNRPQHGFSSINQPVISITSQQGPRIIAPPSFDGTTMSFVVEHI